MTMIFHTCVRRVSHIFLSFVALLFYQFVYKKSVNPSNIFLFNISISKLQSDISSMKSFNNITSSSNVHDRRLPSFFIAGQKSMMKYKVLMFKFRMFGRLFIPGTTNKSFSIKRRSKSA